MESYLAIITRNLHTVVFFCKGIVVGSSNSTSIASPHYNNIYHKSLPGARCSWQISTTNGYILQLTFDNMSMPSCSGCSCSYVEVRDGNTSDDPHIGTYCDGRRSSLVSSTGNQMFVDILAVSSTTVFEQQSSLRKVSPSYHHVGAETRS